MQALVKYGTQPGNVELRDVPQPQPGPGEVLLAVHAAGICGSDLEMYHHKITYPVNVPVIQGHEFSGVVAEVGEGVTAYQPGDKVVSETAAYICGECAYCRTGNYNLCPKRLGFGVKINGAFAPYVAVPQRILHKVPGSVDLTEAALTEPLCVAYNALVRKSRIAPGDNVVIIGAGPIGLMATQIARTCGASNIVLAGLSTDRKRLDVGRELGATQTVNVEEESLEEIVSGLGDGLGAELVVDAAGPSSSVAQAMAVVRPNAQITKIAWGPRPLNLSLDPLLAKAVALQGVFSHTWDTWEHTLRLMASGQVRLGPMITHRCNLTEWRQAYQAVEDRKAIKAVILPGSTPEENEASNDGRRA